MKLSMRISKQIFSVLVIVGLVLSCSKDGNDGAVGPQGPQGEQGPQGPQGAEGSDGEIGTANVIYSEWIASELDDNIIATGSGFSVEVSELTQEVMDTGVILGYGKNDFVVGSNIYQLPFLSGTNQYLVRPAEPGMIRFEVSSIEGLSVGTSFFEEYRYVIIPGGNPASSGKSSTVINYNKMSYEEIIEHFNIPE